MESERVGMGVEKWKSSARAGPPAQWALPAPHCTHRKAQENVKLVLQPGLLDLAAQGLWSVLKVVHPLAGGQRLVATSGAGKESRARACAGMGAAEARAAQGGAA